MSACPSPVVYFGSVIGSATCRAGALAVVARKGSGKLECEEWSARYVADSLLYGSAWFVGHKLREARRHG